MIREFFAALVNPGVPFIRYALIAGLLSSISFGIIGSFVVVKRISYIAGAISHAALAGIGGALYLRHAYGIESISPLHGAVVAALAAAFIIGMVTTRYKEREDTVIGTIWAIGMAIGLLFISKTPGYVDPMSYLFGNILLVGRQELYLILILDLLVITVGILFYQQFLALSFDEEFTKLRGIRTQLYYILLIFLIALTVVLMVTVVGIVMVIALLTIPAATAGIFSKKLWHMMVLGGILCALFTSLGLGTSYMLDLPSGSTTIVIAGIIYLLSLGSRRFT
ncbi:MAG: metal ABC transporter permease [Spirochaetota bacterium]|nr:metal ABC transporter permease [Spirochaetota bacterium]